MENTNLFGTHPVEQVNRSHKGQRVLYAGEKAVALAVSPVFTIKILGRCQIICGHPLYDEVTPYNSNTPSVEDTLGVYPHDNTIQKRL